jgi:hypothetical protein
MLQGQEFSILLSLIKPDLIIMMVAYLDESGTSFGAEYACVVGYVFEPEQYHKFDQEWREALVQYGIKCFHMADCAHGIGEFKGMSKLNRTALARRCIEIIKRRARMGVVASVAHEDHLFFKTENGLDDIYVLCACWCVAGVYAWAKQNAPNRKISYFFESGANLQSRADLALADAHKNPKLRENYLSHAFINKTSAYGLQAADLLAWEWRKELDNLLGQKHRLRRASLINLLGSPHIFCHLSKDHLYGLLTEQDETLLRKFNVLRPDSRNLNRLYLVRDVPL